MPVPVTTMDQYNGSVFWKNEVWNSGKLSAMKAKPKAVSVQIATDNQFRSCVLVPDVAHHLAAFLRIDDVRHLLKSCCGLGKQRVNLVRQSCLSKSLKADDGNSLPDAFQRVAAGIFKLGLVDGL